MAHIVSFDCYEVNLTSGQLFKHGVRIPLRDKSVVLLAALLEHPGELVKREELRHRLWHDDVFVDFDNNLNTVLGRLREALNDSAEHPRFIETVPRRGYRFIANVRPASSVSRDAEPRKARLLVLPFANLSGDQGKEYFSDAMTDETITAIASLSPERLAVIARTTSMHYKGSRKDVQQISRELDVDYVVEGGVRHTDKRIVINVQLIDVRDQSHLFAKRYETALPDLFQVESIIARAVAAHINTTPNAASVERWSLAQTPTSNLSAYDAYIRGRYHFGAWLPERLAKAKRHFEEAIAQDPEFALAHDALAETYWWMGFLGLVRPKDAFSAGVFSALRAIEINPTLAETHALLGVFRKELDYNWPEVQREMNLALELGPESPLVHFRYATSGLMPLGRMEESIAELELALESDPLSLLIRAWLGEVLYLARQYDQAEKEAIVLQELDSSYFLAYLVIGQVFCEQGRFAEAVTELSKAAELSGNAPLVMGWLGMSLARSGNTSAARKVLTGLREAAMQMYVPPTSFAWIHLALDEIDEGFTFMERAIEERDPIIIPIKLYPFLDPQRGNQRFAHMLLKMNLGTGTK